MFKKIALSILFTTDTIHNVTAEDKHGEPCNVFCTGEGPDTVTKLHCHSISIRGDYLQDEEGNKWKYKECTYEFYWTKDPQKQIEGRPCISDHECDYQVRHEYRKQISMQDPRLWCDYENEQVGNTIELCSESNPCKCKVPPSTTEPLGGSHSDHGKECIITCPDPLYCEDVIMNGNPQGSKACVKHKQLDMDNKDKKCISDHECDDHTDKPSYLKRLVCAWTDPGDKGKGAVCTDPRGIKPVALHPVPPAGRAAPLREYPNKQAIPEGIPPNDNPPQIAIDPTMESLSQTIRVVPGTYDNSLANKQAQLPPTTPQSERDYGAKSEAPSKTSETSEDSHNPPFDHEENGGHYGDMSAGTASAESE